MAAIIEASFQVLEQSGTALTTTRVAEVAGVSVGTLYQYFPNREALMNGVLEALLDAAIHALEVAAADHTLPLAAAAEQAVRAFLAVKAERIPVSRALARVFGPGKLDTRPAVRAATQRGAMAVAGMLTARGVAPTTAAGRATVACAAIEGMMRMVEDDPERLADPQWIEYVVYVGVHALTG